MATTDAAGRFSIPGVPSGRQYLSRLATNPGTWVYAVTPFEMPPGAGVVAPDTHLCRGFNVASPADGEVLRTPDRCSGGNPTWTQCYAVRVLRDGQDTYVFSRGDRDARLTTTVAEVDVDLAPGKYSWRADAFNRQGHIIGCTYYPRSFVISAVDHGGYRPHYQGYGVNTPGGRGGAILKVTNLNDGGPGSLRAAKEASGPRIVIFEVSGTISLNSQITVTSPFLTVAGQTAPSPGITVRYAAIRVATHDVVVQHLRVRLGDTYQSPGSSCAFYIWSDEVATDNVVLDHMSLSWGTATLLDVIGRWRQIAVLDSLFAFNLRTNNSRDRSGVTECVLA